MRKKGRARIRVVTVYLPPEHLEKIDRLVKEGYFPNRSEFIRHALRDYVLREYGVVEVKRKEIEDRKREEQIEQEVARLMLSGR